MQPAQPYRPRVFDAEELAAIAAVVEERDLLVISDEIWADVVYPGATHVPFASLSEIAARRTVTATAASKAFNVAGLRCAVAHIGDDGCADSHRRAATPSAWRRELARRGGNARRVDRGRTVARRDGVVPDPARPPPGRLRAELPEVRRALPRRPTWRGSTSARTAIADDPAAWLLEHGRVALSAGPDFGTPGKGYARVNFATTREVLDEIVDRLVEVVRA